MKLMTQTYPHVCVAVYDEELVVVQLQNELAKLEVDILHTQSHNLRLDQTLKLLDQDMNEKMQTISKYEVRAPTQLLVAMHGLQLHRLQCIASQVCLSCNAQHTGALYTVL